MCTLALAVMNPQDCACVVFFIFTLLLLFFFFFFVKWDYCSNNNVRHPDALFSFLYLSLSRSLFQILKSNTRCGSGLSRLPHKCLVSPGFFTNCTHTHTHTHTHTDTHTVRWKTSMIRHSKMNTESIYFRSHSLINDVFLFCFIHECYYKQSSSHTAV